MTVLLSSHTTGQGKEGRREKRRVDEAPTIYSCDKSCSYSEVPLGQQSPTFLAPGIDSVEDNFSTGRCGVEGRWFFRMIQAHYIYSALYFYYYYILIIYIYYTMTITL